MLRSMAALWFSAALLALPVLARGADEEPVDIDAEVARLTQELADAGLREASCLEAARASSTYTSSSSASSYRSDSTSTFDTADRTTRSRPSVGSRARASTSTSTDTRSGSGSSQGSYSSSTSPTPQMRIAGCREQANGSRQIIRASIQHAKTDPAAFAAIVRVNRVQERKLRAQQAAALEQALLAVRQDLEALISASPPAMGLGAFSGHLESLEQGVRSLSGMVPSDGTGPQMVETIQRAARTFRVARDRWSPGEGQAEEVARLEQTIQETRQKLASRESFVGRAELDAHEHNLKQQKAHLSRSTQQSEAAWRNAVPAGKAALASLGH